MYTQSVTTAHRTAFLILIDASGSMLERTLYEDRLVPKSEAVAAITNALLFELIERARRHNGVRDYYDVAVWGYSDHNEVHSLLPGGVSCLSICQLADCEVPIQAQVCVAHGEDGQVTMHKIPTPQWVTAHASGETPMCEAMRQACDFVEMWCNQPEHAESFPPIVFNITDGEPTDCSPKELFEACRRLRSYHTQDGNVLLINIHITANREAPCNIFFADESEIRQCHSHNAHLLYDCSSIMPEIFNEAIREVKGIASRPPYRGMSYNASVTQLISMLNIGSVSQKLE